MTEPAKEYPRLADVVVDTETDGFLDTVSVIHCAVIYNRRTKTEHRYGPDDIPQFLQDLQGHIDMGLVVAAHNGIKYDIPVIQKLHPGFYMPGSQMADTLTLSRLVYPDIKEGDKGLLQKKILPGKLWGSHSLKAWGYRLGVLKGEYGAQEDAWTVFRPEMLDYCAQDVQVTLKLLERLERHQPTAQSVQLEHGVAWLMAKQERNGFAFNEEKGRALYMRLVTDRTAIENRLREWFPPWRVDLPDFVPKVNNKKQGYVKGVPVKKWKDMVFNPGSRDHIAERLQTLFGWTPTEFTEGGKPKVDEEVVSVLPYPPCKDLLQYLLIQKRIGMLGDGDNAWLKLTKNGFIHGSVNTNGAVTGRATHSYPNIAQTPAGGSPYGKDCRELFGIPAGWAHLVGADASGLELRCLAHYMARFDGGAYIKVLLEGDVHSVNQKAAGLPTRDNAKTFILNIGMTCGKPLD